jgi:hypothetical protein
LRTIEAVHQRRSRRTYLAKPLEAEIQRTIAEMVDLHNRQSGLFVQAVFDRPEWFGGFWKTYGLLSGVRHFLVLSGRKDDPDLEETVGYYGESLVLELTKLGLGTCWVGGSFDKKKVGALTKEDETLVAVIAFGPVADSPAWRESVVRGALFRKKPDIAKFVDSDGSHESWFIEGVTLASIAPSAMHLQPFVFTCREGIVGVRQTGHTPFARVDLGIAKFHFELAVPNGRFDKGDNATLRLR